MHLSKDDIIRFRVKSLFECGKNYPWQFRINVLVVEATGCGDMGLLRDVSVDLYISYG